MLSANLFISETRLIVEYKPKRNSYSYGFIDIFMSDFATGNSVVIELKLFNIVGLFNGARALGTYEIYPHHDKLEVLDKELNLEPEESLFKRNYMYWSKDDKKYISVTVSDHINHGIEQLNRYINTLSSGNANIPNKKIGILDNRIIIEEGRSYLKGILISSFGSQRVLVKETSIMKIDYQYYIKQLV
ncbi:MAG TPA: hypothetical protein VJ697_15785 [Nitrososphaeraceae archaeon]|nr:hypothetical protein [Nitrososphaeraceae archaeon]